MKRESHPLFLRKVSILVFVVLMGVGAFIAFNPAKVADAFVAPVSPSVAVNTDTSAQLYPALTQGSCSWQNYFYAFWVDSSGNLWYSSSTNGNAWRAPSVALVLTSFGGLITAEPSYENPFLMNCNGNSLVVLWAKTQAGAAAGAVTLWVYYSVGVMSSGSVTMGAAVNGPLSSNGNPIHNANANANELGCLGYYAGVVYYCVTTTNASPPTNSVEANNVNVANYSGSLIVNVNLGSNLLYDGSIFMLWQPYSCAFAYGSSMASLSATTIGTDCTVNQLPPSAVGTVVGLNFYLPSYKTGTGSWIVVINQIGTETAEYKWSTTAYNVQTLTTDGQGNFVMIGDATGVSAPVYAFTTNTFATISGPYSLTILGASEGSAGSYWSIAVEPVFSPTLEAFGVGSATTSSSYFFYETVFGIPQSAAAIVQQTVGSCPSALKGHAHYYTMANNTQYWYSGNALGQEVVNTISTQVASIKGSGPHTLYLNLYGTSASITPSQTPSLSNPAILIYSKSFVITPGTVNNTIVLQVNIPLNVAVSAPLPFNFWAVGISGDDHINIYNSTLSGMTSQINLIPATTSAGIASNNKFDLCAIGQYQNILTNTITSVITQAASTTVSVTSTSIVTNILQGTIPETVNYSLLFFVILFPGIVLAAIMGFATHNGPSAGIGFVAGMTVGAGLGYQAGLLPNVGILAVLLIVDVFIMIGVFAAGRGGGV